MNENEITTTMAVDDDTILPDGWTENDDIFAGDEWTGEEQADAPASEPAPESEEAVEEQAAAPTPEQAEAPGEEAAAGDAPTPEQEPKQPNKLKFRARVDRQDLDVELDESELPAIYQKAQVFDRTQAKLAKVVPQMERAEQLAKSIGYDGLDSMLDSAEKNYRDNEVNRLVGEGVHQEVARDMVNRRFAYQPQQKEAPSASAPAGKAPTRDFAAEARGLIEARPELAGKQLPQEVVRACAAEGKNLLVAYAEYEAAQQKAEADRLRRENDVLRQNAASAAKAPVHGTRGGGATDTKAKDDFLRGFDEDG